LEVEMEIRATDDAKFELFIQEIKQKHKIMEKFKKDMTHFMERVRVYLSKVAFCSIYMTHAHFASSHHGLRPLCLLPFVVKKNRLRLTKSQKNSSKNI
jgi:hypothetical protein